MQSLQTCTLRTTRLLTAREREIVPLLHHGLTNQQISARLTISEETVKRHLSNIFDKTGASNRLELVWMTPQYSPTVQELRATVSTLRLKLKTVTRCSVAARSTLTASRHTPPAAPAPER